MKLTKNAILEHIRNTGYPFWTLCIVQNYRRIHLVTYGGDDIDDKDTREAKCEKSTARLLNTLDNFPPDTLFSIELKNVKNGANGSGIIGPLEFVNNNGEMAEPAAINGIPPSALGTVPPGFVSEQYLNGKIEELKAENQKTINDLAFKYREEQFIDRMKRKEQELADLEKEMKDEKKKYESQVGKWADVLGTALSGIITKFVPVLQQQPAALGSAEQPAAEQQPADPKYKAVEQFANELYNHASETEINELINAYKRKQYASNTNTDKTDHGQAA